MKEKIKRTDVNQLGEFQLINRLTQDIAPSLASTVKGVGDDAAILENNGRMIAISTDYLIEGIHFDLMYTPLKHLGYKSVICSLSDICAMNFLPTQFTFSIALSNRFSVEALEELYAGVKQACLSYNVDLVGGDTTSIQKGLVISVTAVGFGKKENITYRSGAKEGDIICVTGDLGASYLGLQILEREKQLYLSQPDIQPDLENQSYLVGRQLKPEARIDSVEYFSKASLIPTSMIDVSDGLASDLFHICNASNVGAFIEEGKVPMRQEAELMAIKFKLDPITCALNGGEDYELLFTVDSKDLEKVRYLPGVSIIGEIVGKKEGVNLHTTGGNIHPIKAQGWNHFSID
jgi:thiamine-monophosphate kinase